MAGLIVIAIVVVFVSGAIAGAVLLVSLASVREDRRTLSRKPLSRIALAGRLVTGLRVSDPAGCGERRPDSTEVKAASSGRARHGGAPEDL